MTAEATAIPLGMDSGDPPDPGLPDNPQPHPEPNPAPNPNPIPDRPNPEPYPPEPAPQDPPIHDPDPPNIDWSLTGSEVGGNSR